MSAEAEEETFVCCCALLWSAATMVGCDDTVNRFVWAAEAQHTESANNKFTFGPKPLAASRI